jgi:hypothetical protein
MNMCFVDKELIKWGQSIDDSEKVVKKKTWNWMKKNNRDEIIFIKSLIWSRVKVK